MSALRDVEEPAKLHGFATPIVIDESMPGYAELIEVLLTHVVPTMKGAA